MVASRAKVVNGTPLITGLQLSADLHRPVVTAHTLPMWYGGRTCTRKAISANWGWSRVTLGSCPVSGISEIFLSMSVKYTHKISKCLVWWDEARYARGNNDMSKMCIPKSCLQFQPEVSEKYKVPIYNLVFHF